MTKFTSSANANRILSTVLLCGFAFSSACAKELPSRTGVQRIAARSQKLDIGDADPVLLEFPDWLTTVKSLDPTVIRVSAIRPNCLRVQSIASGKAVLHAVDRSDRQYSIELNVRASNVSED